MDEEEVELDNCDDDQGMLSGNLRPRRASIIGWIG